MSKYCWLGCDPVNAANGWSCACNCRAQAMALGVSLDTYLAQSVSHNTIPLDLLDLPEDMRALAQAAVGSCERRKNENVREWAERIVLDASKHPDFFLGDSHAHGSKIEGNEGGGCETGAPLPPSDG